MNRKSLTLPSGATTVVRKLSRMDFLDQDRFPVAYLVSSAQKASGAQEGGYTEEQAKFAARIGCVCLLKACGRLRYPDGKVVTIVNKQFDECTDNEVTIEELDDRDAEVIIREVTKLSAITKEDAAEAATFPEQPQGTGVG